MLYELVDLQGDSVSGGRVYRQQLTKSPPPRPENYFFVEKVIKTRRIKGKKEYFVKVICTKVQFTSLLLLIGMLDMLYMQNLTCQTS